MKGKRIIVSVLTLALATSGLAVGCSSKSQTSANSNSETGKQTGKVNISFLNSKADMSKQLEATVKKFNETNKDGINVTVETVTDSVTLVTKYASGNPCTINPIWPSYYGDYADKAMDLSQQDWVKNLNSNVVEKCKYNGKLIAFPYTLEGDGLIYNKTTIEKATGETFDPKSITSLSDLEALYKKIQAKGVSPVEISSDNWSLGDHFIGTAYETQKDPDTYAINDLEAGKEKIEDNVTYNGLLNLLDLNKKYNIYKDSPMSSDYNTTDPENIATGKVAFWFNGDWAWSNISQLLKGEHANDKFGFLPLYADDKTSKNITIGVTNYLFIDNTKATKEQQKAAAEFLNWLVSDPEGEEQFVNTMGIIPAFNNVTVKPKNDLAISIMDYLQAGDNLQFSNFPSDHSTGVGNLMQQYLTDTIDKATLSKSIDEYYTSHK